MYTRDNFVKCNVYYAAAALLLAVGTMPACAQQSVVTDWSTHHIVFTNPGSEMDAIMNGRRPEWQNLVNNPRYRMQQLRRSAAWANRLSKLTAVSEALRQKNLRNGMWAHAIGPSGSGTPVDMYPALFSASFTTASCSDYIVFPVNTPGHSGGPPKGQANFVGFNNLYNGTCGSTPPSVAFAFYVGRGTFQTSPAISLDGTKIAVVESKNSISGTRTNFHVFTLGTNGTGNGSVYSFPATPHTIVDNGATTTTSATNNAIDTYVSVDANPSDTRSSPYVDYVNDVAYLGDDTGKLHKFIGVFNGTPTEVKGGGTGWPSPVATGVILTSPVLDGTSGNIFVGGSDGNLYCIVSSTGSPCSTPSVDVAGAGGGAVLDAPVVDGTAETVFGQANSAGNGNAVLLQASATNLISHVSVDMGAGGTDLYNGDFDNTYYSSSAGAYGGYLYFCGNLSGAATPALYRIGFSASGAMNSANDGNSFQLVASGHTGTGVDCTPLTEVYNGTTDMLFLGVKGHASPSACASQACIMSFTLGTSFPAAPAAVHALGGSNNGSSGIIIDNTSTQAGASQIYFSNLQSATSATQLSQSGLN